MIIEESAGELTSSPACSAVVSADAETYAALARWVRAATGTDQDGWVRGARELLALDGAGWLAVDGAARRYTDSYAVSPIGIAVSGREGWLGPGLFDPTGFVAAITSLHADGRVRERATTVLLGRPGRLRAAALAVRCLDHVRQVREAALLGLGPQVAADLDRDEAALSVLLAGRRRAYAGAAVDLIETTLAASTKPLDVVDTLGRSGDRLVRRWAYTYGHQRGVLDAERVVGLVHGSDQLLRHEAIGWLAGVATTDVLGDLLVSRSSDGHALALRRLPDDDLSTAAIGAFLDAPQSAVREAAQERARRRGVDLVTFYHQRLESRSGSPARIAAALDALVALDAASDLALATTFLHDDSPRVRSAAVRTAATLERHAAVGLLAPMLLDPSPRTASVTARMLARLGAPASIAAVAWASQQPWSRRAAWNLDRAPGGWSRVVADLRAAGDSDATLSRAARSDLRSWLANSAATTYTSPNAAHVQQIRLRLPTAGLPAGEARLVAFHAGL